MKCSVTFRHLKPSDPIREYAEEKIDKISELIRESLYSIHDLSRLKSSQVGEFYRMNMPFELGVEYGCRRFGAEPLRRKRCLVARARGSATTT